eukprot:scaffold772_cov339-Pavlova_lutheri.AAC.78
MDRFVGLPRGEEKNDRVEGENPWKRGMAWHKGKRGANARQCGSKAEWESGRLGERGRGIEALRQERERGRQRGREEEKTEGDREGERQERKRKQRERGREGLRGRAWTCRSWRSHQRTWTGPRDGLATVTDTTDAWKWPKNHAWETRYVPNTWCASVFPPTKVEKRGKHRPRRRTRN